VEFEGNTCQVPVISNADKCYVGVYAGEAPVDVEMLSTTRATIPCQRSVRCGTPPAGNGTGENYTNEARGYAAEAKEAAKTAEEAAEEVAKAGGMKQVATLTVPLVDFEEKPRYDENGMDMGMGRFPKIGGCSIDENNMLLLEKFDEMEGLTENALRSQLGRIFGAKLIRIDVNVYCPYYGIEDSNIYVETVGGIWTWAGGIDSRDVVPTDYSNFDTTHVVYADNISAPSVGVGPRAKYLKLSQALYDVLGKVLNDFGNYENPELVFTAYN
jgi:hypothetical protein